MTTDKILLLLIALLFANYIAVAPAWVPHPLLQFFVRIVIVLSVAGVAILLQILNTRFYSRSAKWGFLVTLGWLIGVVFFLLPSLILLFVNLYLADEKGVLKSKAEIEGKYFYVYRVAGFLEDPRFEVRVKKDYLLTTEMIYSTNDYGAREPYHYFEREGDIIYFTPGESDRREIFDLKRNEEFFYAQVLGCRNLDVV